MEKIALYGALTLPKDGAAGVFSGEASLVEDGVRLTGILRVTRRSEGEMLSPDERRFISSVSEWTEERVVDEVLSTTQVARIEAAPEVHTALRALIEPGLLRAKETASTTALAAAEDVHQQLLVELEKQGFKETPLRSAEALYLSEDGYSEEDIRGNAGVPGLLLSAGVLSRGGWQEIATANRSNFDRLEVLEIRVWNPWGGKLSLEVSAKAFQGISLRKQYWSPLATEDFSGEVPPFQEEFPGWSGGEIRQKTWLYRWVVE